MNIKRDFAERRSAERRKAIRDGVAELHERRGNKAKASSAAISAWMKRFDSARMRS